MMNEKITDRILDRELHLHLFGCLTAEDVWELGKDRWRTKAELLEWYAAEFQKVWGKLPDWERYWKDDTLGFELLKKDFIFSERADFLKFQASFNLLIALFKIEPEDTAVLNHVMRRHRNDGLKYAEYRTILPVTFSKEQISTYLTTIAQATLQFEAEAAGSFSSRLILSIPRENKQAENQYSLLRAWMDANPKLAHAIRGIDFSYIEEGNPPSAKKDFFAKIYQDNAKRQHSPLAIMYHVGESFRGMSLMSSARWVWQAFDAGAHRLGHAISLGLNPQALQNTKTTERVSERTEHLLWIQKNREMLAQGRFEPNFSALHSELSALAERKPEENIEIIYDDHTIHDAKALQEALMHDLSRRGAILESCPTSNLRIGMIEKEEHHPLHRFIENQMKFVISTDDPGIFDIDLMTEETYCKNNLKISNEALHSAATVARESDCFRLAQARKL
jgi:adenosine deaminase